MNPKHSLRTAKWRVGKKIFDMKGNKILFLWLKGARKIEFYSIDSNKKSVTSPSFPASLRLACFITRPLSASGEAGWKVPASSSSSSSSQLSWFNSLVAVRFDILLIRLLSSEVGFNRSVEEYMSKPFLNGPKSYAIDSVVEWPMLPMSMCLTPMPNCPPVKPFFGITKLRIIKFIISVISIFCLLEGCFQFIREAFQYQSNCIFSQTSNPRLQASGITLYLELIIMTLFYQTD